MQGKIPYEVVFGVKSSYEHIKIFGNLCFALHRPKLEDMFASRGWKCVFVGYPYGKKGWKLYDLETHEIFMSRDVIFYEENFPFPFTNNCDKNHTNPTPFKIGQQMGRYVGYDNLRPCIDTLVIQDTVFKH